MSEEHSQQALKEPEAFGKYLLTERIGEGGMAEVFRATTAWAEGVAKEVCVKRILPPLSADRRAREMFIQEARIAASLTHANIVPVYEFGVIDDYYFLAMEFVDGFTLREVMMQSARKKHWFDLPLVLHVVAEALEGLDYAHRKRDADGVPLQIVHRDVTPGNVMASVAGEVKILDFGIAMIGDAQALSQEGRARSEAGRGKPGYMSPEQAVGMAVDQRSDIYALGIVLYELLTHRRLFKEKNAAERLKRQNKVAPPSSVDRKLPADLDEVVLKALRPKAADRYATAAAFRDALLDYLHDRGLRAGRSQVARALVELFELDQEQQAKRPWQVDIRSLGPDSEQLARQPRRQRNRRSTRRISTSVAPVKLQRELAGARRARLLRAALVIAGAAGVLALLVYLFR